jgi:type II secretory pathway pseudopilin PulG
MLTLKARDLMSDPFRNPAVPSQPDIESEPALVSGPFRFRLRSLLLATSILCIILAIIVPTLRMASRSARQMECSSNLKQLILALHNYHDVYKTFPWAITYAQDGTPMHSWRVRVLPYIESGRFYSAYDFDEPWNGPKNGLLGGVVANTGQIPGGTPARKAYCPRCFRCPSASTSQSDMCTNYVMLIDDRPGKPNGPPNLPGTVPPSLDDASAVIIIEMADSDIHWTEPRDMLLSELSMKINDRSKRSVSSYHGCAGIAFANGFVEMLDEKTTEERLRALLAK